MKIRVFNTNLAFVLVVILVVVVTLVEVPCPIDKGTGVIEGAKGLEVEGVESELINLTTLDLGCAEVYDEYTYAVEISLANETAIPIYGGIALKFFIPSKALAVSRLTRLELDGVVELPSEAELLLRYPGGPEVAIPIFVEIPADTAEVVNEIVTFTGFRLDSEHHKMTAEIVEELVCPYCGGTGKVPITEWLGLR